MLKIYFVLSLIIVSTFAQCYGLALNNEKSVNVLSWWGYLDDPRISNAIESQCHVKLSYDEYYTNEEFEKIFNEKKDNYDIIIFSNLIYGSVRNKIENNNSTLFKVAENYYPYFKNYYFTHNYPHNVVFFTHAITGFMYNPSVISINSNQSIFDIFNNAKNNYVILIDDPAEVENLLSLGYLTSGQTWPKEIYTSKNKVKLNYDNLHKITQNSNVFVTNDFNQIYKLNNFAFSFMWSGDSLLAIQQSKKPYKFVLNSKLSFICTDLLAQLKETPQARCVARVLEQPNVMKYVQDSSYYFTPYFQNTTDSSLYHKLYRETKQLLPSLSWIQPAQNFDSLADEWKRIKLQLNEQNNK